MARGGGAGGGGGARIGCSTNKNAVAARAPAPRGTAGVHTRSELFKVTFNAYCMRTCAPQMSVQAARARANRECPIFDQLSEPVKV